MLNLFKTHYSIGKSILTPKDCFDIGRNLDEIVFVEDYFSAFRKIKKISNETGKPFRYGIRINANHSGGKASKVIIFPKNKDGFDELLSIYTKCQTKSAPWKFRALDNCIVTIPFYDSYVHKSLNYFGVCDLPADDLIHFVEYHNHPHDQAITQRLESLGVETKTVNSVFYREGQFKEFQFYKSVCNRSGGGRALSFDRPELDDCGCDTFYARL